MKEDVIDTVEVDGIFVPKEEEPAVKSCAKQEEPIHCTRPIVRPIHFNARKPRTQADEFLEGFNATVDFIDQIFNKLR